MGSGAKAPWIPTVFRRREIYSCGLHAFQGRKNISNPSQLLCKTEDFKKDTQIAKASLLIARSARCHGDDAVSLAGVKFDR